ncbi:TPA: fimbrial protein [Aeromonas veronii]
MIKIILYVTLMLFLAPVWAGNTMTINIMGQVMAAPSCSIVGNNAGRIEVNFGDSLQTHLINGASYKTVIPFSLSCSGNPTNLRLKFTGGASTFDPNVLGTNIPNFGVQLLKPNSSALALDEWFTFAYTGTQPTLWAVPVKKSNILGSELAVGDFGASTTLLLEVL